MPTIVAPKIEAMPSGGFFGGKNLSNQGAPMIDVEPGFRCLESVGTVHGILSLADERNSGGSCHEPMDRSRENALP
jgi:hypothetical protein